MSEAAQNATAALVAWLRIGITDMRFPWVVAAFLFGLVLGRSQNTTLRAVGQALIVAVVAFGVAMMLQLLLTGGVS